MIKNLINLFFLCFVVACASTQNVEINNDNDMGTFETQASVKD